MRRTSVQVAVAVAIALCLCLGTVCAVCAQSPTAAKQTDALSPVIDQWGCTTACSADVDQGGVVNIADLLQLTGWGACG